MPMVKERLRRATAMSAPSLAMACRRRSGRTALFFVALIRSHKIDLKSLKVHYKIPYRKRHSDVSGTYVLEINRPRPGERPRVTVYKRYICAYIPLFNS